MPSTPPAVPRGKQPRFNMQADEHHRVIRLSGELDRTTSAPFLECARRLLAACGGSVRIDLGRLTFIGADGLNALVCLFQEQRRAGQDLVLDPVPSRIGRVFQLGRADFLLAG